MQQILRSEPLHSHEIPKIPFHKVGCDLSDFKNKKYLLLVEYYTKYVELEELHHNTASHNVIKILKIIFARHGVPNVWQMGGLNSLQIFIKNFQLPGILIIKLPRLYTLKVMVWLSDTYKQ